MATRALQVLITGDSTSLRRSLGTVDDQVDRTEKRMHRFGGVAAAALKGVGIAAIGGAAIGLKRSADAAVEAEKSHARMTTQLKASGISFRAHAGEIDRVIQKTSQLAGLDDEDLQDAFTNIVRVTGDVNKSLRLTGLAADFARAKHLDVAKAGEIVGKVAGGNIGILSRYGIQIDKGASSTEALGALQQKFAGQAEAYGRTTGGSLDRLGVAGENLQEVVGQKLTPVLATAADALANLLTRSSELKAPLQNIAGFVDNNQRSFAAFAGAVAGLGAAFITYKLVGTVRGLAAAFIALRAAMLANPFIAVASAIAAVAGALVAMKVAGDDAEASSRDLTAALREQEDAARAVRDIDVDLASRRANAESAAIALERAESRLRTVRKNGKSTALDIRQAENDVRQARVNNTRSQRDLTDAERDAKRKREDLNDSTRKVRDTTTSYRRGLNNKIKSTQDDIKETGKQITAQQQLRARFGGTSEKVDELKRKQKQLREELAQLKSKKIDVDVNIDFQTALANSPGSDAQQGGDGPGITKFIRNTIRGNASKLFNQAGGLGSIPVGGIKGAAGVGLMGARAGMAPFAAIGARFGLTVGSGSRPGATTNSGKQSWHATGEAIDMFSDTQSPDNKKLAYFRFMKQAFGSRLAELIYTPGGTGVWNGQPHVYTGKTASEHYNHVHVAFDLGASGQGDGIGRGPKRRGGDGLGKFSSTAYGPPWNAMNGTGVTATGVDLRPARQAFGIAVDPNRLRLGRSYYVWPNPFARRGPFKAFDTGGAIKGNRLDFYDWRGRSTQMGWGRRDVTVSTTALAGGGGGGGGGGTSGGGTSGGGTSGGGVVAAPKKAGPGPRFSYGGASGFTVAREQGQVSMGTAPGSAVGLDPGIPVSGGRVTGYGIDVSRAQRTQAVGRARNNLATLIKGLVSERRLKWRKVKRIRKLLKGRLRPANRKKWIEEETQLLGEIQDLDATIKEYRADAAGGATTVTGAEALDAGVAADTGAGGDAGTGAGAEAEPGPTREDYLFAQLAEAGLTPGADDDRAALQAIVTLREEELAAARASGDPRRISAAIEAWKSATEALHGVDDSLQRNTEALNGVKDEMKRQNDIYETVIGVSSREAIKTVADIISGQIVGVGLQGRRQTAGTGATVLIP